VLLAARGEGDVVFLSAARHFLNDCVKIEEKDVVQHGAWIGAKFRFCRRELGASLQEASLKPWEKCQLPREFVPGVDRVASDDKSDPLISPAIGPKVRALFAPDAIGVFLRREIRRGLFR
jgi:hypothetical protein